MSTRNRNSVLPVAKTSTSTKKFELPALPLDNFGSLTDGTDIPPPEREPTPPPAPESIPLPASSSTSQIGSGNTNGRKPSQISIAGTDGTRPGTPNGEGMLSPAMSPASPNRPPSSIKRFLSRKSMNADYTSSNQSQSQRNTAMFTNDGLPYSGPSRPESSLSFVSSGGTKTKKKRSWWQKLMGAKEEDETKGANGTPLHKKRTSTVLEKDEPKEILPPRKKGPPPPKLPELKGVSREGGKEGGFGGDDMFSNIR